MPYVVYILVLGMHAVNEHSNNGDCPVYRYPCSHFAVLRQTTFRCLLDANHAL